MNLARVVGRVVATHKDPGLTGTKLLMIQPVDPALRPRGAILLAADAAGAGAGEIVVYVRGREAAHAFLPASVPTDAGVICVVDEVHVEEAAP
jgi:microcompartment protein CcmK/EutM